MKLTDRRIIMGVGLAIVSLGSLGFALGILQGQRPPTEQQPLPIPAGLGHTMNLEAVPKASALDPSAANAAVDPLAGRVKPHRAPAADDNTTADDVAADNAPAAPEQPAPASPANAVHGPF